jgi:hypothetical protein
LGLRVRCTEEEKQSDRSESVREFHLIPPK